MANYSGRALQLEARKRYCRQNFLNSRWFFSEIVFVEFIKLAAHNSGLPFCTDRKI